MISRSPSRSDGEIVDSDTEYKKATKPLPSAKDSHIDRHSRTSISSSRSSSPPYRSSRSSYRSRSRSPFREGKSSKRTRDNDDHYSKSHDKRDRRNFKVHYEDGGSDKHDRSRDTGRSRRYDDDSFSRSRAKRLRTESRSPPRFSNRQSHRTGSKDGDLSDVDRRSHGWGRDVHSELSYSWGIETPPAFRYNGSSSRQRQSSECGVSVTCS